MRNFERNIAPHVTAQITASAQAYKRLDFQESFACLERAHVLGQESTAHHVRVHWEMLRWGMRQRDAKEVVGQLLRLLGAGTKTVVGWVPTGNTGGSNVSPFRPMHIEPELQQLIDDAKTGV